MPGHSGAFCPSWMLCRLKTMEIVPEDKKGSRPKLNCNSGFRGAATSPGSDNERSIRSQSDAQFPILEN
jgi:hypothetical protein